MPRSHMNVASGTLCLQRAVVKPQATVWVCVPKASSHQFHPFTVSSVLNSYDPLQPTIAKLAIKPYGNWAKVSIPGHADCASVPMPGSLTHSKAGR